MTKTYTGKKVAIFTDAHALLEPVEAALDDIKKRGITEIYSLGDNIGDGPDPLGVLKALQDNGVKSIAGNAEEYITLGIDPFISYMEKRKKEVERTRKLIGEEGKRIISTYSHSYELFLGGKKIGLCHFGNDVRIDFDVHSTWSYQSHFDLMGTGERFNSQASKQFEYTASKEQIERIREIGTGDRASISYYGGYLSAYNEPMFPTGQPGIGKKLTVFDDVFQGHVHFKLEDPTEQTNYHTLRAVGMGYRNDPINTASYVILNEFIDQETGKKGFDIEEVLVEFDREKMIYKVINDTTLDSRMIIFTSATPEEINKFRR